MGIARLFFFRSQLTLIEIQRVYIKKKMRKSVLQPRTPQTSQKNRRTMRSTMSTFKSRQSTAGGLATRASIGVRYSMGGKASIGPDSTIKTDKRKLHTNKDPRKLNEKARQRELCSEICDFLLESGYGQSLTMKDLMSISTANYFMVFSHLSGIILGPKHNPKGGAKEEIMISTMKKLDYPFSLQKSSFTNFSLTSWPIVLGVLEFLLRRAQHIIHELNVDGEDFELDEPISRDKENDPFELILMGYKKMITKRDSDRNMDGSILEEINRNIICDYEDFKYQGFEEEADYIEQSMKSYQKENELYDQRSKEKLNLEAELNDKLAKSSQIEKYQKYEDQMTDFHTAALERDQNKMIENSKIKSQLESEIGLLTEKIGDKETALDLRKKFEEIHTELGRKLEEKLGVEKIKTNLDISVSKAKSNISDEIQKYNCLILDNEIDKKYLIESNNEFESLPASEDVFQDQIQILNTEITAKKFKQQEAEFRLKEFTSKKSEIKVETENEISKFERKKRQVERLTEAEQMKVVTLEDLQIKLLDQSDEVEALKNQEKSRLADLTQYNNENNIEKLESKIQKFEDEANNTLVENMIKAQDEVDFMAEETTKLLNLQIEEKLRQIQKIEEQTAQLPHFN